MSENNNFQQILEGVVSKVTGDNADEVKTSLRQLGILHKDSVEKLISFGEENKDKRLSITKLEKDLRNATDATNKLTADLEDTTSKGDTINQELETLRNFKTDALKERLASFSSTMEEIIEHPKFEALKGNFNLPEPKADGSYDISSLTPDEMDVNLKKYNEYQGLGFFESSNPPKDVDGSKQSKKVLGVQEEIDSATTMDDLLKVQATMD